jgi:hypothetical protein
MFPRHLFPDPRQTHSRSVRYLPEAGISAHGFIDSLSLNSVYFSDIRIQQYLLSPDFNDAVLQVFISYQLYCYLLFNAIEHFSIYSPQPFPAFPIPDARSKLFWLSVSHKDHALFAWMNVDN